MKNAIDELNRAEEEIDGLIHRLQTRMRVANNMLGSTPAADQATTRAYLRAMAKLVDTEILIGRWIADSYRKLGR